MGAAYIIYGHILRQTVKRCSTAGPCYVALNLWQRFCTRLCYRRINEENAWQCIDAGAYGVCMMSKYMEL